MEWKEIRLEFVRRNGGVNKSAIPIKSRKLYETWVEEGLLSKRTEFGEIVYEYVKTG